MSFQKLKQIFPEDMSAKRVKRQLDLLGETPELKKTIDLKFIFISGELFTAIITLKQAYFSSIPANKRPRQNLQFRISYTKHYPYDKPKLYVTSKLLNQNHTVSCRDYLNDLCNNNWSTKYQLLDLIKLLLPFYRKIIQFNPINPYGVYTRGDFIQIKSITEDSEIHFTTFDIEGKPERAYLILNRMDVIILQTTSLDNYCRIAEVYPIRTIKAIYKNKANPKQIMIFIKWGAREGGFEFETDNVLHSQRIMNSIQQKKSIYEIQYKELEEEFKQRLEPKPNPLPSPSKNPQSVSANYLEELNESIMVVQSILQKQYSDAQLSNLISLYKKGVQFCSAYNVSNYTFYLKKLQELLVRQETQALINSTSMNEKKAINESIFDFFDDK